MIVELRMSENLLLDVQMEIHVTDDRTPINCHSFRGRWRLSKCTSLD